MPSKYGNCFIDVPTPVCNPCASGDELGGVRGVAFIHRDAIEQIQANPTNAAIWDMLRQDSLVFIIPETRGTFNGGEVVTRPGFGNKATVNVGFNYSLEYDDPAYKTNCTFYNQIMQSHMYHVAFVTETQIKISAQPVDIAPTAPITDSVDDQAAWHVIVTWNDKLQPCPFDMPTETFECLDYTNWKPTFFATNGALQSSQLTGAPVDDATLDYNNIVVGNIYVNPDTGAVETISKDGGDIIFLISQPYDAVPTALPRGADMRVFGASHWYGVQTTAEAPTLKYRGKCGIFSDGVSTLDTSTDCDCQTASPSFHDTLEQRQNFPILLPNKYYYFGAYAKGAGMLGSFTAQLNQLKTPDAAASDPATPCTSPYQFLAEADITSVPWVNP